MNQYVLQLHDSVIPTRKSAQFESEEGVVITTTLMKREFTGKPNRTRKQEKIQFCEVLLKKIGENVRFKKLIAFTKNFIDYDFCRFIFFERFSLSCGLNVF